MSMRRLAMIVGLAVGAAALAAEHPEHPKSNPAPAADAKGSGLLDKKVYPGELTGGSAGKADQDELRFEHGTFVSSACKRFGFDAAPYTATKENGVISFTASPRNAAGETMEWTGTVKGNMVEATAVHKTSSGETTYHYKGTAGKAKADKQPSEHPEHPR